MKVDPIMLPPDHDRIEPVEGQSWVEGGAYTSSGADTVRLAAVGPFVTMDGFVMGENASTPAPETLPALTLPEAGKLGTGFEPSARPVPLFNSGARNLVHRPSPEAAFNGPDPLTGPPDVFRTGMQATPREQARDMREIGATSAFERSA